MVAVVLLKVRSSKTINVSTLYDYTVGNQSEIAKLLSKKDGGKNAMRLANTLLSVMSSTPNSDLKTKDKIKVWTSRLKINALLLSTTKEFSWCPLGTLSKIERTFLKFEIRILKSSQSWGKKETFSWVLHYNKRQKFIPVLNYSTQQSMGIPCCQEIDAGIKLDNPRWYLNRENHIKGINQVRFDFKWLQRLFFVSFFFYPPLKNVAVQWCFSSKMRWSSTRQKLKLMTFKAWF